MILTDTYFAGSPSQATMAVQDSDAAANIVPVAALNAPVGIDYHPVINALIVSVNLSQQSVGGEPVNFARVDSSGSSNAWSTLHGMGFPDDEIKLAIVKVSTNGWTQGDMYFGTAQVGKIGKITADGSSVNTNWAALPGEMNFLGGSLCFDQTGLFSNDLVAATSEGGVWLISSLGETNKLANIPLELECVLTLPNDTNKYGPWAGKILTGNELDFRLFTIDTNKVVTPWPFPAPAENLNLIPANQDLYAVDAGNLDSTNGRVWKISRNAFTNYVGDILVTHEGNVDRQPKHVIVHWDGTSFVTTDLINTNAINYEQATFAPVSFDSH